MLRLTEVFELSNSKDELTFSEMGKIQEKQIKRYNK